MVRDEANEQERMLQDFKRVVHRPFCGLNEWRTEKDRAGRIDGRCCHGKRVEECFACSGSD